ncbi:MarR family winged helix-turn-helix transcriptional regulator [Geodermatophilus sabuli]|uniref:DNA-binding transcriptional regulator, MarR family n=1 Tax=Geodermatophilus sabuli TaxID=1564158 RepID=A0A285EB36_9ACTN|nr:MarR family winged helix-turn-helix transcriptional regulator [Geodermatophilus sabuli]MBB3085168.1 DNA-binding MarR family transcriptional regulator [Geodermatophilus sabuli]SNX95424.1 DNA-binding transcriptional regulator, MarR family [Geodermatophilus sabuli]
MPITPQTRDRLTAGVARIVRSGRHLSVRAADALYGDLPSYGWALLVPLQQDGEQRCSALAARAGVDVSVASRQLAVLERSGYVARRADPDDGRASLMYLTEAGAAALAGTRALRAEWAQTALAGWDESDARRLSDLLERLATDLDASAAAGASRTAS